MSGSQKTAKISSPVEKGLGSEVFHSINGPKGPSTDSGEDRRVEPLRVAWEKGLTPTPLYRWMDTYTHTHTKSGTYADIVG